VFPHIIVFIFVLKDANVENENLTHETIDSTYEKDCIFILFSDCFGIFPLVFFDASFPLLTFIVSRLQVSHHHYEGFIAF